MTISIVVLVFWVLCGIGAAGTTFSYFQGEYPELAEDDRRGDLIFSILSSFLGPFALVVSVIFSGFWKYGWRLK